MMLRCLFFLFLTMVGDSLGQDTIVPASKEERVLDGSRVTLSCNYSTVNAYSLQWYRQHPGSKPEFLILILVSSVEKTDKRFTVKHDKKNSRVHLEISSAEVADSAMYYCALQRTTADKLIFGDGTKLLIESGKPSSPRYYKLKDKDNVVSACLATDFSAYNATDAVDLFKRTETNPTRIGKDPFDKVVILTKDIEKCPELNETETDVCDSGAGGIIETDEKINFLSLTILGLRILFLKSIVFNVLMTLRAWMS